MKITYDGLRRRWFCGNCGMWKSGATPQAAVAAWKAGL